jgi:2-(1,2-epoxy-1,2-dihydrophenyl)acetyl-CoA isomerase
MTSTDNILCNVDGGIARITLNRPTAGNALDLALATDLAAAALRCDHYSGVKAVLITANGRMFCAGGDLKAFSGFRDQADVRIKEIADQFHKAIALFARMRALVVVAVNGPAAGAGFSLALAGDYVLAAESARFTMAYTAAGLTPDGGSTYHLTRLVGLRRAQELVLTNRTLSAEEALAWGIVTRVVSDANLAEEAESVCRRFAAGPAHAHAAAKQLLLNSLRSGLEEQMEMEGRGIARCAMSSDGKEGVRAFLEKRKPVFK